MTPDLAKKETCTGCGACLNACEYDALLFKEDERGFFYPSIDSDKCVQCGLCEQSCPIVHPLKGHKPVGQCYALWAMPEIRENSSSGGAFSLFAQEVIAQGGEVFGAALGNDLRVRHVAVSSLDRLHLIRRSKYVQSEIGDAFTQVRRLLSKGKVVLFSGCPCHIAGLKAYLGQDYETLYTIDVVCHGIKANKALTQFLDESIGISNVKTVQFRNKTNGWVPNVLTVVMHDDSIRHIPYEQCSFEQAFHQNVDLRPSCYDCPFCGTSRQGDITMGDFWGVEAFSKDWNDQKGTSIVLVNSGKGQRLFDQIKSAAQRVEQVPIRYGVSGNRFHEKL